jgi:hypothetical protein
MYNQFTYHATGRKLSQNRDGLVLPDDAKITLDQLSEWGINFTKPGHTMDTAVIGPALSNGYILPNLLRTTFSDPIRELTQMASIDAITGITISGKWTDEELMWLTSSYFGKAEIYSDLSNTPLATFNGSQEIRGVLRGEQGFQYGALEEAKYSAIGYNAGEEKRQAVRVALEDFRNLVGYYGFAATTSPIYGVLNDPGLPNYITLTAWTSFDLVVAGIQNLFSTLEIRGRGYIDSTRPLTLVLPMGYSARLAYMNTMGVTALQFIMQNYPKMRIVYVNEFIGPNGGANVAYLFQDQVGPVDGPSASPIIQIVPTKYQLVGFEQNAKGYVEVASNATAGVVVLRPWAIVRGTGL